MLESCGTKLDSVGSIKVGPASRRTRPPLTLRQLEQPTNLYPLRAAVNAENEREFKKLKERAFTFYADDTSKGPRAADVMKNRVGPSLL